MDEFLQLPNDPPVVLDVDSDPWANPNFDSFYNDQTYPDTSYVADVFASTPAPGTPGLSIGSPLKPLTNEGHTHSERNDSSMQPRHPLASSSSPESSSQESSSESSGRGRKRKSSSLSNPYELLNDMDSPNMTNGVGKSKLGLPSGRVHRGGSPLIPTRADQDLERIGQRLEHDFAFSNHNSPGTGVEQMTIAPAQLEFIQNRVAPSPPAKRSDWIIGDSRDGSPSMTISNEGSPSAPFDPTSPTFASPGFGNAVTSFSTPSGNNPAWQQSNFNLGVSPSPAQNSYFSRPSSARRPSGSDFKTMFRAVPSQWKSRVETQIIMTLYAYPLPPEVQKLHLPTVSISKPKFLAKDIIKSPDTLELHTSLVCASAMRNAETRRMAMLRAQGVSIKSEGSTSPMEDVDDGSSNDNDPDKPLNGGEVHICENCMAREHKRATRKRTKQQDGEETWFQYAKDRIIIFNEKEYQEWKPADPKDTVMGEQLPEGTMKISVPTRIACYCRHQQEKIGFQIIFTLKDYKGNVITQTITDAITITDDHKTNGNNHPMQEPAATQPAPGLQRPYHSANDLQALQQSSQLQFHHHHPPAFAQRPDAFSQSTSATMTPHSYQSLSRQASPSAQAGPNKRRKGSGSHHHRLPSNLTMTRLDTSQQAIGMQGLSSAGSNHGLVGGAFTPVSASFMQPADLMAAISMPANPASPPTPSTAGAPLTPGLPMRNQSGDNLASFYSLPNSAQASRSGSPVGGMRTGHSMAAFQQQLPQNPFANQYGGSHSAIDLQSQVRQQPVVYKVLPNEGPLSGGKEVTCLGSGFTRTTEVFFGGIAAVPVTYWAPSALVCLTPPGAKPGAVPVTVRDTSNGAMSNAQSHTTSAVFTYTDDGEKQLLELVLRVIGDKHQGNPEGFKSFLMNIVESSNGGWAPGAGGSHSGYRHNQRGIFDAGGEREMDTEDILMKCLDVIDMDESPYAPQYNMRMDNGETMLSLACSLGFTRFVAALLARGADPETRDRNGFTPLMKAALHGHANLVRRLLLKGADPTLRSLKGYLAVDLATTDEVAEVLRRLPHRRRTRSGGDERVRSRANSLVSLHSVWDTPSPSLLSRRSSRVESPEADVDSDDSDVVQAPIPTQVWIQSRRNSTVLDSHALVTPLPEDQNRFLSPAAATAAMAAWGNHLAAQIQQFQQNVNWNFPNFQLPALPPMPQLPGYQAHPMMRRISSLVPHRTPSRNANPAVEATDAPQDSSWRDLFSSSPALPPAYEEIYPEGGSDEQTDLKKSSALEAAADTLLDRKCSELFDRQSTRASSSTAAALRTVTEDSDTDLDVRIGNGIVTKEAQEKMKRAHAKKLKKIRSDRNLWMIWIPLLLVLLGMMLKNRIFDMVAIGARYFPGSQQAAPLQRIVEIA